MKTPEPNQHPTIALYAMAALTGVSLATSALLLWSTGVPAGPAIVAAAPPSLLLGVIGLASRFLCKAMPLREASRSSIAAAHAGSAVAASSLWLVIWRAWLAILARGSGTAIKPDFSLLFGLGVMLYFAAVAVHYLMLELDASREAEEAALRYRVLAREAELRAFKAQLDPHFLFNSLNAIASLCGTRPLDAREMTQKLADFFRLVLRFGSLQEVTLSEEIDLVSRYLSIEKVRFGDRLDVHIEVDERAGNCKVPPLLLQPLVENAVRHGVASMLEGGRLEIRASMNDEALRIRIDNPADPERTDVRGEGIGLQNARGRLGAISEGRARLDAFERAGQFRVDIELPQ
ncbi:MAG: histidine kinase [Acidobacteriota bacterium]